MKKIFSKRTSLIILGITAVLCSRVMFAFFNDPEGPNLLVVVVMAAVIYLPSLASYLYYSSATGTKKLLLAICLQIVIVTGLYLLLN